MREKACPQILPMGGRARLIRYLCSRATGDYSVCLSGCLSPSPVRVNHILGHSEHGILHGLLGLTLVRRM